MKISLKFFFKVIFILSFFMIFIFGGFIQYFIGVPNTLYTLIVVGMIYVAISFDIILSGKIFFDKFIFLCLIYLVFILFSGFINNAELKKTVLYCLFALIPLGAYYFHKILYRREVNYKLFLTNFYKLVVLIQLPIILIQKFGFDYLIKLNNSNQSINEYDFMFGTFFIKADHALGMFLLVYALNIIFKIRNKVINKDNWFMLAYVILTVFVLESNLTKVILLVVLLYYLFAALYKKVSILSIILVGMLGYILLNLALKIPAIDAQYYYFKNRYNTKESQIAFERGYAKRPQVVVAYFTGIPIKITGEGPYNYFNIFTGEFNGTNHFSQLIWTYNDLGIIGLMIVILLAYFLVKSLSLDRESSRLFLLILVLYLFMSTTFSDLAMIFSILLLSNFAIEVSLKD